jgi:hypothetical protein
MRVVMRKITLLLALSYVFLMVGLVAAEEVADYDLAVEYYNSGKYEEALQILEVYVEDKPEPTVYYMIAYSLYKLGRHDESSEYFKEAFLLDPSFSPTPSLIAAGKLPPRTQRLTEAAPQEKPVTQPTADETIAIPIVPDMEFVVEAPVEPVVEAPVEPVVEAPVEPVVEAPVEPVVEAPVEPVVEAPVEPVAPAPVKPPVVIPTAPPAAGIALIIALAVSLLVYLFFSFCIFRIAKKTNVSKPWLAWIPIAQVFPLIGAAGKPWWWFFLLFVPLLNIIVQVYLFMLIAGNLGKNKLLGLLILLPVVNLALIVFLAFSKGGAVSAGISDISEPESDFSVDDLGFSDDDLGFSDDTTSETPAEEPSFGAEEPSFGAEEPSFGAEEPSFGAEEPSFGAEEPSFGAEETEEPAATEEISFGNEEPAATEEISFGTEEPAETEEFTFDTEEPAATEEISFGTEEPAETEDFTFGNVEPSMEEQPETESSEEEQTEWSDMPDWPEESDTENQ